MSYGDPVPCKNQCGAWIYFDKDSKVGHPNADKWLPLEYNHDNGIKTGLVHQCRNRPKQQQQQQVQVRNEDDPLAPVSDESVQRGITAFSMMSDLIRLVEQTQKLLVTMDGKLDRLLNLAEIKK